ncbi:hypothetical protein [Microterricola viridarii]|uniref:Uncharacterized protein n=1 Tax=Microterricola viridarii TaxID=412690 RepID=A0A0X8E406_9MICO|nr:hypothetical protein [Microterricola viridarii]AMB58993.1 hypothetical protein AWU67_09110 [Microterricola viridarii]
MNPAAIDYRPLTEPVAPGAVSEFRGWARSTRQPWARSSDAARVLVAIFAVLAGLLVVVAIAIGGSILAVAAATLGTASLVAAAPMLLILVLGVLVAVLVLRRADLSGGWQQKYRLFHFAQANGMQWYPQIGDPGYPGIIFGRGSGRAAYSGARATSGRALDIGNFMYTTGSGDDRTVHRWGSWRSDWTAGSRTASSMRGRTTRGSAPPTSAPSPRNRCCASKEISTTTSRCTARAATSPTRCTSSRPT